MLILNIIKFYFFRLIFGHNLYYTTMGLSNNFYYWYLLSRNKLSSTTFVDDFLIITSINKNLEDDTSLGISREFVESIIAKYINHTATEAEVIFNILFKYVECLSYYDDIRHSALVSVLHTKKKKTTSSELLKAFIKYSKSQRNYELSSTIRTLINSNKSKYYINFILQHYNFSQNTELLEDVIRASNDTTQAVILYLMNSGRSLNAQGHESIKEYMHPHFGHAYNRHRQRIISTILPVYMSPPISNNLDLRNNILPWMDRITISNIAENIDNGFNLNRFVEKYGYLIKIDSSKLDKEINAFIDMIKYRTFESSDYDLLSLINRLFHTKHNLNFTYLITKYQVLDDTEFNLYKTFNSAYSAKNPDSENFYERKLELQRTVYRNQFKGKFYIINRHALDFARVLDPSNKENESLILLSDIDNSYIRDSISDSIKYIAKNKKPYSHSY